MRKRVDVYGEALLKEAVAELDADRSRLRAAIIEFLAAEDAVEKEAARAEANGGWSSAPVVRRIYAVKALRAALEAAT
jgi:hypothetical protein